jgi:hypothetical protein
LLGVKIKDKQPFKDYFNDFNKQYEGQSHDFSYLSNDVLMVEKILMHRDYNLWGKQDEIMGD